MLNLLANDTEGRRRVLDPSFSFFLFIFELVGISFDYKSWVKLGFWSWKFKFFLVFKRKNLIFVDVCGTHILLSLSLFTYLYPHLPTLVFQPFLSLQSQRKLRFHSLYGTIACKPAPFSPTAPRSIGLLYVHYNDRRIRITYTYIIRLLPVYYTFIIHLLYILLYVP